MVFLIYFVSICTLALTFLWIATMEGENPWGRVFWTLYFVLVLAWVVLGTQQLLSLV